MDGAKSPRKRGTAARHVGQPKGATQADVFRHWLRATPVLDRIEWIDTWYRPDGKPRKLSELRYEQPYTGLVRVLDARRDLWEML